MANMTLRLDDDEEILLGDVMKHYRESTKSKALIKMIRNHMYQVNLAKEYIEKHRGSERNLGDLIRAVQNLEHAKKRVSELISD